MRASALILKDSAQRASCCSLVMLKDSGLPSTGRLLLVSADIALVLAEVPAPVAGVLRAVLSLALVTEIHVLLSCPVDPGCLGHPCYSSSGIFSASLAQHPSL